MKTILTAASLMTLIALGPKGARADDPMTEGIRLYNQGEFEAAIQALEQPLGWVKNRELRARGHLYRGLSEAVLGAWPEARGSFERALLDDPEVVVDRERVPPATAAVFDEVRGALRSQLEVVSSTRAVVRVDGVTAGPTPLVGQWPIGRHAVVVETEDGTRGFNKADVLFRADEPTRIVAVLAPRFGMMTLRSFPAGAEVTYDGKIIGRTPLERFALPAGAATATLRMPRYAEQRLAVQVPPDGEVSADATLTLAPEAAAATEAPPMWGPDRRAFADAWTIDVGMGGSGAVPVSASVQTADPERLGVSGGGALQLDVGASLFDLVQLSAVFALETFGPDLSLYSEVLAEPGSSTDFVFDPGISGTLQMRQARLGLESRVTVVRIGRLRTFLGFGVYALPSVGSVISVTPSTSDSARDAYAVRAELNASSVAPLFGAKWTLWERPKVGGYFAVDLLVEGRVEVVSWSAPIIEISAGNEASRARAVAAGGRWARALTQEGSSVSGGLVVSIMGRI